MRVSLIAFLNLTILNIEFKNIDRHKLQSQNEKQNRGLFVLNLKGKFLNKLFWDIKATGR